MSEEINDVRRALTIVFRGAEGMPRPDVERAFSFDMEWVAPHEAEAVVDALLNAGWLEEKSGELHLLSPLGEVDVPFGWVPRPTRLLRPVAASAMSADDAASSPETPDRTADGETGAIAAPSTDERPAPPAAADDPRARLTQRVARFISRQSGLELEELHRRADRKIKAFQLITPWMAYALVAREQGLVMDDIAKALDVV